MSDFSTVEDTLFVPMLGRIYATENFPNILNDQKAVELKNLLPDNLKGKDTQTQYTYLASAVRSSNMDRYIKEFMSKHKDGVIAEFGCGIETTYYRNNNGINNWFEFDLPDVIKYRRKLLPEPENSTYFEGDGFSEEWIKELRNKYPTNPILVTASGIFYYFSESKILDLFKMLKNYGDIEIVFDAVNSKGMKQMSKYMKQVGHEDAQMYFYVDDGNSVAKIVGGTLISEEKYYAYTSKKGLSFMTSMSMRVSDWLMMVKMIHIKLN